MVAVAVSGGLVFLGMFVLQEFGRFLIPLVLGGLFTIGTLWAALNLFFQVFSPAGLAYSFGLGSGATLDWPNAVRVTTLLLTVELVTLAVWLADYLDDRGPRNAGPAWLWAHLSGICRVIWHTALAPVMLIRDCCYHRAARWPIRPRTRFLLAAVLGDLAGDLARGLWWSLTTTRRIRWRRLVTVNRTVPVPRDEAVVVDGEGVAGEVLQTWRAGENLPALRESAEARRERTRV